MMTSNSRFLEPNSANTLSLLERCSTMEELKQIHAQMLKTGLASDVIPASKLIAFSVLPNSGNLTHAGKVFDGFSCPNTFMWNTMIKGYANSNEPEEAFYLYRRMVSQSAVHNNYTFPSVLKACSGFSALEETQQIHAHIIKMGFGSDVYALNSLLHVYATTRSIELAKLLFDRIPERNIVSWTTMISGYVNAGLHKEALSLFHEMQLAGVEPDSITLTSALAACSHLMALDQGSWIHSYINKNVIHIDPILGCALIDMYVKCGSMDRALKIFKNIKRKDVSTWTAIIEGFAIHGQGRKALDWFKQMQNAGIKPNHITFTAILTACSYAGLVNEGKSLFQSMKVDHQLNPSIEHFGCMVDLFGRAGMLEEAKEFVETMPLTPNDAVWGALLNACKIHRNLELGKQIGKVLIELGPANNGQYIQLSSIHAAASEWNQAVNVRKQMKDLGISKLPGCSLISLNGVVHEFFAGDSSHPLMGKIYCAWESVAKRLRQEGYEPATGNLLLDIGDAEKQWAIQQHSEKLAITLGLIESKSGEPIRVFNNLRICEDCHNAAKLISDIYGTDIILRDRVRFHVFREGKCSCGDYW